MTQSLIKRLEALTEPSREMDAEISRACGIEARDVLDKVKPTNFECRVGWLHRPEGQSHWTPLPHYTGSIDAALPDEYIFALHRFTDSYFATALSRNGICYKGEAKTEAIARRIAALKAVGVE